MKYMRVFVLFVIFLGKSKCVSENFYAEYPGIDQTTGAKFVCRNTYSGLSWHSTSSGSMNVEWIKYQCEDPIDNLVVNLDDLNRFPNLYSLDVSNLRLQKFKVTSYGKVEANRKLRTLSLSHNQLTKINSKMLYEHLPRLIELDFSDNPLEYLNLDGFDINDNKITKVNFSQCAPEQDIEPEAFSTLLNLDVIDLSYCGLGNLHENLFKNNMKIREIYLSNNPTLKRFHAKVFSRIHSLEVLDMSNTGIEKLDGSLKNNVKLRDLNLRENPLKRFSFSILSHDVRSVEVHLPSNSVEELDISCAQPNCQYFDNINLVDQDFLKNLRVFTASGNQKQFWKLLKKIGSTLETLHLSSIEFDNNTINGRFLHRFTNLQYLVLSRSHISKIEDDAFNSQSNLKSLVITDNDLENFDSVDWPFDSLEILNLEGNQLNTIDQIPMSFRKLKSLAISRNQFSCAYLNDFLKRWGKKIHLVRNPTDQRKNLKGIDCNDVTPIPKPRKDETKPIITKSESISISATDMATTEETNECQSSPTWAYVVIGIQSGVIIMLIVWLVIRIRYKNGFVPNIVSLGMDNHSIIQKQTSNSNNQNDNDYEEVMITNNDYVAPQSYNDRDQHSRLDLIEELRQAPLPRYLPMLPIHQRSQK